MLDRQELVTAALLGTDRRPLPAELPVAGDTDPAVVLLDWAARSSAAQRAGGALPLLADGPAAPAQTRPVAPPAARELLGLLLARPQPPLIDFWLSTAVRTGYGIAPQHWAALVSVAARNGELSRPLLGVALGERGRWFVAQNPQWARLVSALSAPPVPESTEPTPVVDVESVRADPRAILTAAPPWPVDATLAAMAAIGTVRLGWQTTSFAVALGVRLPIEHYHLIQSAADYYAEQLRVGQGVLLAREGFAAVDGAFQTAREIEQAFPPGPPDEQESP